MFFFATLNLFLTVDDFWRKLKNLESWTEDTHKDDLKFIKLWMKITERYYRKWIEVWQFLGCFFVFVFNFIYRLCCFAVCYNQIKMYFVVKFK